MGSAGSTQLRAGVARADITDYDAGPVNDPLYAKALVLTDDTTTVVIVTVDAVAFGEIGRIGSEVVPNVRTRLQADLGIEPGNVIMCASHCHGVVCDDVEKRTIEAVTNACKTMEPVRIGAGVGREDRIMENRRLRLNDGTEADVRHAYSLPADEDVASVGPVDPEIGVLRLDRQDARPLAVVYNFACHPIQGVPSGANTADISGFASSAVEDSLGDGVTALFLQGCAGDINPVLYKDVDHPRNGESLGDRLGLSVLKALASIECCGEGRLCVVSETIELPRADLAGLIDSLEDEQAQLLQSLAGTTLNLKAYLHLVARYGLAPDFPSYASHRYLHEKAMGRDDWKQLDAGNRSHIDRYTKNIHVMEQLTKVQANLGLLKMHHAQNVAAGKPTIEVEVAGVRIGGLVLVTFPGELSVQIGLNIKRRSPHEFTFVATCANGYIYYAPTADQLRNRGKAQEDSDCLLAPEWQELFEDRAQAVLTRLLG